MTVDGINKLSLGKLICFSIAKQHNLNTIERDKYTNEGPTSIQLCEDAAKAPHVYGHGVGQTQDHLGRAVEPTLYVCVH